MKIAHRFLVASLATLAMSAANASVIADTGAGGSGGGYSLYSNQWLGNTFTLTQATTITAIDAWLGGANGTLSVAVLSMAGGMPGTTLYSASATSISGANIWVGVTGENWLLQAGTYLAAFEVPAGYSYSGWITSTPATPSGTSYYTNGGNWNSMGVSAINFQVFGTAGAASNNVPEPGSLALMGLAAAALVIGRRKRA